MAYAALSSASNTYSAGSPTIWVERDLEAGPTCIVTVGLMKFPTAANLPDDAIVSAVTLTMYVGTMVTTPADALSLVAGYQSWDGSSASDWQSTPVTNAHSGTLISTLSSGSFVNLALANLSNINTATDTYIKLWLTEPSVGNPPTGDNYLPFVSADHSTNSGDRPVLTVTYSLPTTRLAPDGIISRTNLPNWESGGSPMGTATDLNALQAIDEDPDSADSNWLTV